MKHALYTQYGPPEVMQLMEVVRPAPKENEILLRIHATTVTATEASFRKGEPFVTRLFTGLRQPNIKVLGEELSGEVVAIGEAVSRFQIGDQVFGTAGPTFGANAEYICLPEGDAVLAHKPRNMSFEEAAASVDGFLTALPFLRDKGLIGPGQKVLIYGASGSVGSAAVQIAQYYGAEVSAVCSTTNIPLVRRLGAHHVIDYTKEDFAESSQRYDIIFDAVGKRSFADSKRALRPDGIFLEAGIDLKALFAVVWTRFFSRQKARIAATGLRPPAERVEDLRLLKQLMEEGVIRPVIDRQYDLEEIQAAHRYVDTGRKKGNVVIRMAS